MCWRFADSWRFGPHGIIRMKCDVFGDGGLQRSDNQPIRRIIFSQCLAHWGQTRLHVALDKAGPQTDAVAIRDQADR